jgi:carboxypeptidase C (cathepsin A)
MAENAEPSENNDAPKLEEKAPVNTRHQIDVNGRTLGYTATVGMMPLKNDKDEIDAEMFYMAYTLDDAEVAERPLMFVFNGGPGSSSIWLHMGTCGPKRVKMEDEGWMPAPPFALVENEQTWLDLADLVFIDPVGTGYSRAKDDEKAKQYWNVHGDLEGVSEFIRLYLTRAKRWTSPLFLAGESYGTTRAAGLAGMLFDKGVALNGVVLISTILNYQTAMFTRGNDLPYILYLPTYTATAYYHGKLPDDLQNKPLREVIAEVENWAETDYTLALMKGDRLSEDEHHQVAETLARYTGLSETYLKHTNLRIHIQRFCKELLRDQNRTVGRLDSRFKGRSALAVGDYPEFDPSLTDITPPYNALFSTYVRDELGYETDRKYEVLSFNVNGSWEWPRMGYPDTSEHLRSALAKNPHMHVLVAQGYFDLATPHFAAHYTLNHMDIAPDVRDNIHYTDYEAGHMLYLEVGSLAKLKADVAQLIETAT